MLFIPFATILVVLPFASLALFRGEGRELSRFALGSDVITSVYSEEDADLISAFVFPSGSKRVSLSN